MTNIVPDMLGFSLDKRDSAYLGRHGKRLRFKETIINLLRNDWILLTSFIVPFRLLSRSGFYINNHLKAIVKSYNHNLITRHLFSQFVF